MIGADAEFIVQRCILAEPDEPDEDETASRERRGVVMGAVQSGKTASMLAVIAKSLDAGVDAVVVLGGTRTALWLQTWERLLGQLDTLEEKHRRRVMLPTIDPSGSHQRSRWGQPSTSSTRTRSPEPSTGTGRSSLLP